MVTSTWRRCPVEMAILPHRVFDLVAMVYSLGEGGACRGSDQSSFAQGYQAFHQSKKSSFPSSKPPCHQGTSSKPSCHQGTSSKASCSQGVEARPNTHHTRGPPVASQHQGPH